jgi:hypothetical protein
VGEFLLALLTVFLGALLAFFVDNLRERRRLAEWVRRYLRDVRGGLADTTRALTPVLASLAETADALSNLVDDKQPQWETLATATATTPPDLMSALRGEGITAVPPHVVSALQGVETSAQELHLRANRLASMHDRFILPIYLERPSRITTIERRGIELFAQGHAEFRRAAEFAARSIEDAVRALRDAGY